jgi:mono/diheme cytochrome c family protein
MKLVKFKALSKFYLFAGLTAVAGVIVFSGCGKKTDQASVAPTVDTQKAEAAAPSPVERGKYLVNAVAGCNDCHTPLKMGAQGPEPDMTRMLSGHPENMQLPPAPKAQGPWMVNGVATMTAWAGPWGVSYTANLTPDSTGLAAWDETTFLLAIKNGKHIGNGRPILPPMPWQNFRNMTDDDLKAIFAYLKTIPAIKNKVPEPIMAAPPTAMK